MHLDLAICQRANRYCAFERIRQFFSMISSLGNGKFWFALMLLLPAVFGKQGLETSIHMAILGVTGIFVYKLIKHLTHRPRPYASHVSIQLGAAPLDQYSFPSGHTLHAVMFTMTVCGAIPAMAWLLLPFCVLVAASRVILGLHYPTDVVLGGLIGAGLAWWMPLPALF